MSKKMRLRPLISNNNAISEEFTTLPALSVVMIGFTLFFILLANTYGAYESRIESLEKYKTADFIATKLTNPDSFFIKEGGVVNVDLLKTAESKEKLNSIKNEYRQTGYDFTLRISWDASQQDFPEDLSTAVNERVAVSKDVGVYINEAQTKPGTLTIILWSVF